jgi:hypothetical protein
MSNPSSQPADKPIETEGEKEYGYGVDVGNQ